MLTCRQALFIQWVDEEKKRFLAAEAGGGIQWNGYEVSYRTAMLDELGSSPLPLPGDAGGSGDAAKAVNGPVMRGVQA